jgi:hypothetical protein
MMQKANNLIVSQEPFSKVQSFGEAPGSSRLNRPSQFT